MILNKCGTHIIMFKTYFLYHQNAHFILEGVVTTFQVYIIIVFFMTTKVKPKVKISGINFFCNHMPSQLISFYLLISLEGMSTLIQSQGHQIEPFILFCFRSRFRSCLLIVFVMRALLSSALSKRFFCNLILFV